jgi:hypothetical protein
MNRKRWSAVGAALGLGAALLVLTPGPAVAAAGHRCPLPKFGPGASYHPHFKAGRHTANVTNPWFPLAVGTTSVYAGTKDGETALHIVTNSGATRVIDGVRTRVVEDHCPVRQSKSAPATTTHRTAAATSGTSAKTPLN